MSKQKPTDIIAKALETSLDALFQPTLDQQKAKSAFWHAVSQGLVPDQGIDTNLSTALRYANDTRISQWWDRPAFLDWFLNREDFRQQAAWVGELSLTELEKILRGSWSKDKLQAIKLGLEVAGKLKQVESAPADKDIAGMTKEQLEEFIAKRQGLVPTILVPSDDSDSN